MTQLPPNPLDAFDNLDLRVGVLERKQYAATGGGGGAGTPQALAVQKWKLNAACNIANGAWTDIGPMVQVTADSSDTGNAISVTAGPSITTITCLKDGIYTLVWFTSLIASNSNGSRLVRIIRVADNMTVADNGQLVVQGPGITNSPRATAVVTLWAKANDQFRVQYWQNSGTTLALSADTINSPCALYVAFHGNKEPKGDKGDTGSTGAPGQGIPTGGAAGQTLVKLSGTDYDTQWQTPSAVVSGDEVLISAATPGAPNFELWVDTDDDTGNTVGSGSFVFNLPQDTMVPATPGSAYSNGITFMQVQNVLAAWPSAPSEIWTFKEGNLVSQECRDGSTNTVYRREWNGSSWTAWGLIVSANMLTGMWRRLATVARVASSSNATASQVVNTTTLPSTSAVSGHIFRIQATADLQPDTAGMFASLTVNVGPGTTTGATQIAQQYVDFRAASRTVGIYVMGEYVYGTNGEADGLTNFNIVAVAAPSGGGVLCNQAASRPAFLFVDEMMT